VKKNRYIPYGYTIKNGQTVIEQSEAEIIREIFSEYINGASMKEIADSLTSQSIPYIERQSIWCKAKVARIIDNIKYLGTDEYEAIVDRLTFDTAVECKATRKKNTIGRSYPELAEISKRMRCDQCGSVMIRNTSNACRIRESWTCSNSECKNTVRISDSALMDKLTILMNRIIENHDLLIPKKRINNTDNIKVIKLENELRRECEKKTPDEDKILEKIREIATVQYEDINCSDSVMATVIYNKICRMSTQESFSLECFTDIVSEINLKVDGRVCIITALDTKISEGDSYNGS